MAQEQVIRRWAREGKERLLRLVEDLQASGEVEREQLILGEQDASDLRVMLETCKHDDFSARHSISDLSDNSVAYGKCRGCKQWLVMTTWATVKEPDFRPMNDREIARLAEKEDAWMDADRFAL